MPCQLASLEATGHLPSSRMWTYTLLSLSVSFDIMSSKCRVNEFSDTTMWSSQSSSMFKDMPVLGVTTKRNFYVLLTKIGDNISSWSSLCQEQRAQCLKVKVLEKEEFSRPISSQLLDSWLFCVTFYIGRDFNFYLLCHLLS